MLHAPIFRRTTRPHLTATRPARWTGAVLVALVMTAVPTAIASAAPPTEAQRLERLAERLEQARVGQHIPGLAIAVVKDDQIVFKQGFGLANVDEGIAVDTHTQFAIGSTTKALTTAAIAMLVDEGTMTWDDPITKWLPAFEPKIDAPEGVTLTLRDMLSHRTGFTRMSMLWIGGAVSRERMLEIASEAEPWAPFGEKFLYNNIMYMAAGMAAGEAAGSSWEALIRDRLFAPLGMSGANLTMAEATASGHLALGYTWDKDAFKHTPMRNIDIIGPAGSINADVLDMAQWLRLSLGRGTFEGTRLISQDNLLETWTPQITIGGDLKYGLGWMLHDWNGHELVEHGGNIDGFAAQVAMLPKENIGFVLLTNTGFSPLQSGSIDLVFDAMLGDWDTEPGTDEEGAPGAAHAADADLEALTGVFIANYATFDQERFTVAVNDDGKLTLDIPSQMMFTLDEPGDNGRRPFVGIKQIAAAFETGEDGKAAVLVLYQGGLRFEVPREGYVYPVEVPLEELEAFTGGYHFEPMNDAMTVLIRNNHLAVDIPGQMVFETFPPDEDGTWSFRNNDVVKIAVSFQKDAFGTVESMTLFQGGQEFILPKLAGASNEDLPTLDEVFALARLDERQQALEAVTPIRLSGTARFVHSGIKGTVTMTFDARDHSVSLIDMGPFGTIRASLNGEQAWSDSTMSVMKELTGRQYEAARRDHPSMFLGDWRPLYSSFRVESRSVIDDRPVIVVIAASDDVPSATFSIDAQTGDILRVSTFVEVSELGNVRVPTTNNYSGWVEHGGLRMPTVNTAESQQNGRFIIEVTDREMRVVVPEGTYDIGTND